MIDRIIQVVQSCLITEQEQDRKGEPANIVDGLFALARAIDRLRVRLEKLQPTEEESKK